MRHFLVVLRESESSHWRLEGALLSRDISDICHPVGSSRRIRNACKVPSWDWNSSRKSVGRVGKIHCWREDCRLIYGWYSGQSAPGLIRRGRSWFAGQIPVQKESVL